MELRDREGIRQILAQVKVFSTEEINVALELLDSYISGSSDYIVNVATDDNGNVLGYVCYGKTPLTDAVWDLYWVVVGEEFQGRGIAGRLLDFMESNLKANNARAVMVETSSRPDYKPARDFYLRKGFSEVCGIEDFYAEGNDKIVYRKRLKR